MVATMPALHTTMQRLSLRQHRNGQTSPAYADMTTHAVLLEPSLTDSHALVRFESLLSELDEPGFRSQRRTTGSSWTTSRAPSFISAVQSSWGLMVPRLRAQRIAHALVYGHGDDRCVDSVQIPAMRLEDLRVHGILGHGASALVHLAEAPGWGKVALKTGLPCDAEPDPLDEFSELEAQHALEMHAICCAHARAAQGSLLGHLTSFLVRPVACVLQSPEEDSMRPTIAGLAFEYCEGGSLQPHLETAWRHGWQPVQSTRALFCLTLQVAGGVAAINHAGFAHRDLSPHNVLLKSSLESLDDIYLGAVKVADLGASAICVGGNREQAPFFDCGEGGAAAHIAPEALAGCRRGEYEVSARQDAFSVGILMFLTVSPRLPWSSRPASEVLSMVQAGSLVHAFAECIPDAPAVYINIALWLCDHDPAARMLCVRAHAMLAHLHTSWLAGEEKSIEDLAAQFSCRRHPLLPLFRVDGAALPSPRPPVDPRPTPPQHSVDAMSQPLELPVESPTAERNDAVGETAREEAVSEGMGHTSEGDGSTSRESSSVGLLPCLPPTLLSQLGREVVTVDQKLMNCEEAGGCVLDTTSSAPSAEIPAVVGDCTEGAMGCARKELEPTAEVMCVKCDMGQEWVEQRSCVAGGSQEGVVRRGWLDRAKAKCRAAVDKVFKRKGSHAVAGGSSASGGLRRPMACLCGGRSSRLDD